MRKYQILFSILLIVVFMLSFYLDSLSLKKTRPIFLQDLNKTMIDFLSILPIDQNQTHPTTHELWGMKISRILEDREFQRIAIEKLKLQEKDTKEEVKKHEHVNVHYKTICIEKKCWLFVGKIDIGDVKAVTLLSKDNAPKLESYKVGDYLSKKTKVIDIDGNEMLVTNEDTMQSFKLKLFDVSLSQYKPKQ